MRKRKALISGITGQDGSYLAEYLLSLGYEVHGIVRKHSHAGGTANIDHIKEQLTLHTGSLASFDSIVSILSRVQPDEIYNLAAQSHVATSYDIPLDTADMNYIGVLRFLEAVRIVCPTARLYQASTSEMFGKAPAPQGEDTPFAPTSTYACAKIAAYYNVIHHRNAFGLFAAQGILFNHETIAGFEPVIFREGVGEIDIKPISEVVRNHSGVSLDESKDCYQEGFVTKDLYLWDAGGWTKVKFASGYPHKKETENKNPRYIVSKNASYMGTGSHPCIMQDLSEKAFSNITIGDQVNLIEYPIIESTSDSSLEEAELLGLLVGDGSITENNVKFTNSLTALRTKVEELWLSVGGTSTYYYPSKSGFTGKIVGQLSLNGNKDWVRALDIYTEDGGKRVPRRILNGTKEVQLAFLKGYNQADGLKQNACTYEFKNFKTNSATLAAGLVYLIHTTTGQNFNINIEQDVKWGNDALYYSINLLSDSDFSLGASVEKARVVRELLTCGAPKRTIARETGISRSFVNKVERGYDGVTKHWMSVESNEVKKIIELPDYDGWFYDLETASGTFHCGVGRGHVHNSERRPETFVSRKITKAAARIKLGLQGELRLGNLETGRDWGYARDYVRAMHLMLQHDTPEEFVIGTGVCTSIQDFLDKSFSYFDLNWKDYVVQDPAFMRPLDHHELRGDYSKAKRLLGWEPETNIDQLVEIMCAHDYKVEGGDNPQMWFTSSTPEGVIVTGSDHEIKPIGAEAHGVRIIKKYDKPIYTCGGGPQTNK